MDGRNYEKVEAAPFKKKMDLRDLQKDLRKNGELISEDSVRTGSELKLGQALVDAGIKIISGHYIDHWEFDFKVLEYPVLIEVDGSIHNNVNKRQNDYSKDRLAQIKGFRVLRFSNQEIDSNIESVVAHVKSCIRSCGKQPRLVFIYPLSPWEQFKLWYHRKVLRRRMSYRFSFRNLVDEKVEKFVPWGGEK